MTAVTVLPNTTACDCANCREPIAAIHIAIPESYAATQLCTACALRHAQAVLNAIADTMKEPT